MQSDLGLVGCKLGPIYQNVDPLGPDFLRVCEALERLELPMLIHQGTTFARAGLAAAGTADPARRDRVAVPEAQDRDRPHRPSVVRRGDRRRPASPARLRRHLGLVTRRWLLYQALVSAIEYRVEHKLLFGTDYPFFSARQTIDGLRSVTGNAFGPQHAGRRPAGGGGHHPPPHPRAPGDHCAPTR